MGDVTVSVRVREDLHRQMKVRDEINWSAVIRKSIEGKIEEIGAIDRRRLDEACKSMDCIRKGRFFSKGKSSEDIIREWRDKRRF